MPDYRLYCLNGTSHIANGEWFEAASDDDAIAIVRSKKLRIDCEIWHRGHLVAEIPACSAAGR